MSRHIYGIDLFRKCDRIGGGAVVNVSDGRDFRMVVCV